MAWIEGETSTGAAAAHELLGLAADERDPVRIVEAAAARLRALESAGGSEIAVRRSLAGLIRRARDAMLEAVAD
jgi:hypothetical protein